MQKTLHILAFCDKIYAEGADTMKRNVPPQADIINILPGHSYTIVRKLNDEPNMIDFKLHNHEDIYEIVFLHNGDCEFVVEGNAYKLNRNDIIFTRPFEFHHIICLSEKPYERTILYLKSDFFNEHDCGEFLDIFVNRELGTGNMISSAISDNGLRDCIQRIYGYYENKAYKAAEGCIIEFLYLLNNARSIEDNSYAKNERIRDIIIYINNNLTDDLSLDNISSKFFIDKYYLCKSFKKNTGYTLNRYINYKRILLASELHRQGQTLLQASLNAGFNSYSHFYKTYVKQTGKPPGSMN